MAVTPTYPGVYIQELPSAVHPITGVATSIGAFVGYTARGIDNRAEHIYSLADYERLFGGLASDSELSYAVQQFFNNGGTEAYVVRAPRANAADAAVEFGPSTTVNLVFAALSSGEWANGELILDVDYNGLTEAVAGSMVVAGTGVTGTLTSFTTVLQRNQWLVFANDPMQTPYQIASISSNTALTLATAYAGPGTPTTATVTDDPTAFNLTITNLVDDTVETFPNVSLNNSLNNYITNVVNDIDNGSQLVNVTVNGTFPAAPAQSWIVGTAIFAANVATSIAGSTAVANPVTVTYGSSEVTGTALTALKIGQLLMFASDPTETLYTIASIDSSGTFLLLSSSYTGTNATGTAATVVNTTPTADWGIQLSASSPATAPLPLPISLKVFVNGVPLPLTVAGLAAQLQKAINGALAVQMPGATPKNGPAWSRLPDKMSHNFTLEQFFLAACIDFHNSHPASQYRGLTVRHLFSSVAEACDIRRAARTGFTHLWGATKSHPAVGKRLEERTRREDPAFFRRCERVAASAT